MNRFSHTIGILGLLAVFVPTSAAGQASGTPHLHVDDAHRSCFFDLHPELTQAEFREFTSELGSILRFRQFGDTVPLGKGRVDLSFQFTSSPIDDGKGAWNNTMSHPAADHYLGPAIRIPRIAARFGVSDRVDLGVWGAYNAHSNYGVAGFDTKVALVTQGLLSPVSVSIRPSVGTLVGPSEVWVGNAAIDVSVSRAFGAVSPYGGVATSGSVGLEMADDVDLQPAYANGSVAYAGVAYRWRRLVVAAEIEKAALVSYGFVVGTRF